MVKSKNEGSKIPSKKITLDQTRILAITSTDVKLSKQYLKSTDEEK